MPSFIIRTKQQITKRKRKRQKKENQKRESKRDFGYGCCNHVQ